jgi:branched-chain amino acid transport system substrate-binding protein
MAMADDPNTPWECEGAPPKYNKHELIENPAGTEICIICKRPRNYSGGGGSNNPPIPWSKVGAAAVILGLLGGLGYGISGLFKPCPTGQQKQGFSCVAVAVKSTSTPTSTPTVTSTIERYSSGENRLFVGKANPDSERGIEAFQNGQYSQAVQYFEKAVSGDRNSPEHQIYLNNAKARLAGSPFLIGAVVPIDTAASSAEEMLRGVADAQTRFNQVGGLNGRLLEVIIANDSNDPQRATEVAKRLASDPNLLGVIGHNSSDASQAGLAEYKKAGVPMISPTSTSTALSGDNFFRTLPSDAINGQKLADYARYSLGIETVAIFYNPNSSYSKSLEIAFSQAFQQFGGRVVKTIDLSNQQLEPQREIQNLQGQTEAIVLFPNTAYISVAIALAVANNNQMKLLGGDALYNPNTLTSGSNAVEGLILAVPWFAEGKYAEAAERRWLGQVNWRTAMSFDATQAMINALSEQASRSSVLQNIRNISLSNADTSGNLLQFESTGDRQGDPILVQAVKGGRNAPKGTQFSFQPIK